MLPSIVAVPIILNVQGRFNLGAKGSLAPSGKSWEAATFKLLYYPKKNYMISTIGNYL